MDRGYRGFRLLARGRDHTGREPIPSRLPDNKFVTNGERIARQRKQRVRSTLVVDQRRLAIRRLYVYGRSSRPGESGHAQSGTGNDAGFVDRHLYLERRVRGFQLLAGGGNNTGRDQMYPGGPVANFSATVPGLPTSGSTVYVRLWSLLSGAWQSNDYSYVSAIAASGAMILSPTPGSTLTSSTVTFTWSAGSAVSAYWLEVGTTPSGNQIYPGSPVTNLSASVPGLPTNGSTVYVRLWSLLSGGWQSRDYSYATTAAPSDPVILSPTPGSTLTSSTVTFSWSAGSGVSAYWFEVGTTLGGNQIYPGSAVTNLFAIVPALPANGSTVYVRLWSLSGGGWHFNDSTYTSATGPSRAGMLSPAPGSTLSASTVTFTWSTGSGVSAYWLEVGTTPGGNQIYAGSSVTGLSATVSGIPTNGSIVYVRLWSLIGAAWSFADYAYNSSGGP